MAIQYIRGYGANSNASAGVTRYAPMLMGMNGNTATETDSSISEIIASTVSKFNVNVSTNTIDAGTTTVTTSINTSPGAISISVAFGVTGFASDLVNSDTLAVGDKYTTKTVASGASGNFNHAAIALFKVSTTTMMNGIDKSVSLTTANTTFYESIAGAVGNGTTESDVQAKMSVATTANNLQVRVRTNSRSEASTIRSRKNTANGNMVISVAAGVTGIVTDAVNTDSIAVNDLFNFSVALGASSSSFNASTWACAFTYTATSYDLFAWGVEVTGSTYTATTNRYYTPTAFMTGTGSGTESNRQMAVGMPITVTHARVNATANSLSTNATFTTRKNTAAGNATVSVTAGVTGVYEDTTHTDTFSSAADLFAYNLAGGTSGTLTLSYMACQVFDPNSGPTITGIGSIAGISTIQF